MRVTRFEHRFVEHFPDQLEPGVLYVSLPFASVAHGCACGCGNEVVTPLSPTGWRLTFNGKSISLYPSIGNWSYPCRSHYWIKHGVVEWSYDMSRAEIEAGRKYARATRAGYYETPQQVDKVEQQLPASLHNNPPNQRRSILSRFWEWLNDK